MSGPLRLGVLGAGNVCEHYLPKLATYPDIHLVMIGDRNPERAAERADTFGFDRWGSVDEVVGATDIEAILNLTPPAAHLELSLAAITAGKHVYSEKPLAMEPAAAGQLVDAARQRGVVLASAPDVTLSAAFRAALAELDSGTIGAPLFARCEAVLAGPELWHPRPQFLYARGGGPLFDIGPYYLTAIVEALGPIRSVTAQGTRKSDRRVIGSGELAGQDFPVEVPTLVASLLELESGLTVTMLLTFDSASHRGGWLEVLGQKGTLRTPDPNGHDFAPAVLPEVDEDARTTPGATSQWRPIPFEGEIAILAPGLVNFARHIRGLEPLVVDGARAAHVVEAMTAIQESAASGERVQVTSTFAPSPRLPLGWDPAQPNL